MPKRERDTLKFLELMNNANEAIVAREEGKKKLATVGEDPIRAQRDAERRKDGPLRARERQGKRVSRVRSVFGFVDLSD